MSTPQPTNVPASQPIQVPESPYSIVGKRIYRKKTNNPYDYGIIYIIESPSTDEVYVGSTAQTLTARLRVHKAKLTAYCESNGETEYCYSFNILEWGDATIRLLEEFPTCCKTRLENREKIHIHQWFPHAVNKLKGVYYPNFKCQCPCQINDD